MPLSIYVHFSWSKGSQLREGEELWSDTIASKIGLGLMGMNRVSTISVACHWLQMLEMV